MTSGRELTVATSETYSDNYLTAVLQSEGIVVRRGPLDDVLKRFVIATSDMREEDYCVRLTADNPFPDGAFVDNLVERFQASTEDYMSANEIFPGRLPIGLSAEIFLVGSLREADSLASAPSDREHVTPYMREHLNSGVSGKDLGANFQHVTVQNAADTFRCTIDTLEDYLRIANFFHSVQEPIEQSWLQLLNDFRLCTSEEAHDP